MILRNYTIAFLACLVFCSLKPPVNLTGTWQYMGGVYNGAKSDPPKEYTMKRVYTDKGFAAYASQKGYKTERYEAGNYVLKGDTCFETQTFSSRPSQITSKTIAYAFRLQNSELVFSGRLPSGMVVEEHWMKVK